MLVEISNFKCYEGTRRFEFKDRTLALLKGPSGVGKSTVLQAIFWALYRNISRVSPVSSPKVRTQVRLRIGDLYIMRQKNPRLFQVQRKTGSSSSEEDVSSDALGPFEGLPMYVDQEAQALVEGLFGPLNVVATSCYIPQCSRSGFLGLSQSEKMAFLQRMAFSDEDREQTIAKIESRLNTAMSSYKVMELELQKEFHYLTSIPYDVSKVWNTERMNETRETIQNLQLLLETQERQMRERTRILGILSQMDRERSGLMLVIERGTEVEKEERAEIETSTFQTRIHEIQEKMRVHEGEARQRDRRRMLRESIEKMGTLTEWKDHREAVGDLHGVEMKERARMENESRAKNLGISYTEEARTSLISQLTAILDAQARKEQWLQTQVQRREQQAQMQALKARAQALKARVSSLRDALRNIPPDTELPSRETLRLEREKLLARRGEIVRSQELLSCPSCSHPLRLVHGSSDSRPRLTKESGEVLSTEEADEGLRLIGTSLVALQQEEKKIDVQEENGRRRRGLEEELRTLEPLITEDKEDTEKDEGSQYGKDEKEDPGLPLNARELAVIRGRLQEALRMEIIPVPRPSSVEIRGFMERQRLISELETLGPDVEPMPVEAMRLELMSLISKVAEIGKENEMIRGDNRRIRAENERIRTERVRQQMAKERLVSLEMEYHTQNSQIPPEVDPVATRGHLESLRIQLQEAQSHTATHERRERYTQRTAVLQTQHSLLQQLTRLRSAALETECFLLDSVVESLNATLETIIPLLFDKPLNVSLQLFRELKSGVQKPQVNFMIEIQGALYDSINLLSGGEGDRISLALTLAFNSLSSCPLLLLDETLSGLDPELKEVAIRTIRSSAPTKTVLVINHEGTEGIFDSVHRLGDSRDSP